ncbi:MAG: hypothetical protein OXI27_07580 [Thaumarchaeota archaeon]|nr:hypothetical protein [Nitrososphaerota archaeon]
MPHAAGKRQYGAYYTKQSPFELRPFKDWARSAGLGDCTVLEPFAGANDIVRMLQDSDACSRFACYDVASEAGQPAKDGIRVRRQDTLRSFPTGYHACVTNPPWLARNSAHRRGLEFRAPRKYDDVYKYALELALANCSYVAFIIPATFLRSRLFRNRLKTFVLLEQKLFTDTDNPVCLALFTPRPQRTEVWADNECLGYLDRLEDKYNLKVPNASGRLIRFNAPGGALGLRGVDNTKKASIHFCRGSELAHRTVRHSDRSITRIDPGVSVTSKMIEELNEFLYKFRQDIHDVFLAPFKGLREDGHYRRRLDYATARGLISRNV